MKNVSFRNDVLPLKDKFYRLALRITLNAVEAEDIVQDTLIKLWNKRDNWHEIESIEAFGLTICRNLSLDCIKKQENNNASLDNAPTEKFKDVSTPYERMLHKDRLELIKKLIDALPEKQRSWIQLRDIEGQTYKDIAAILAITEEQVKVNIFRARQTIKTKFKEFDNYGL